MEISGTIRWIAFASILCASVFINQTAARGESTKGEEEMTVAVGREVSIEYTLTLEDKSVVDSNVGAEPLIFTQGAHHIIPGLENGLEGMKTGEVRQVTVKPEEGYGVIDREAFVEVNKEELPAEGLTVGAHIQGEDANGQVLHAQVKEIKDKTVILDFNHPLAGKTLYFDVKIVGIQEAR